MSTTAQGDTYENKVLQLVKRLIADETIAVGKHYSVHQKNHIPLTLEQTALSQIFP